MRRRWGSIRCERRINHTSTYNLIVPSKDGNTASRLHTESFKFEVSHAILVPTSKQPYDLSMPCKWFLSKALGHCMSSALTAAQACTIPDMDCIKPNATVSNSTAAATQNVYHCTFFLSSCHHEAIPLGSESSKACFKITSRSRQYWNLSICLSEAFGAL